MKIAIPVFGNRISPRFDFAPMFALFEVDGEKIAESGMISCEGWHELERVSQLTELAIDTVICGGVPHHLMDVFANSGIQVIPWVAGDAIEALSLFVRGRLSQGMVVCQGRRSRKGICHRDLRKRKQAFDNKWMDKEE